MGSEEIVSVKVIAGSAPLAAGICGHDRPVLYNLAVGYLCHRDDRTQCAASTRSLRRDEGVSPSER